MVVQRVGRSDKVEAQLCVCVERASDVDQSAGEIGVDSPIPMFVGIGKRGASHWSAESAVIEFAPLCGQTHFDVAKAFAIGQLGEGHCQQLIPTRERAHTLVAVVARDAAVEFVVRQEAYELSKYGSSLVQMHSPSRLISKDNGTKPSDKNSNRLGSA